MVGRSFTDCTMTVKVCCTRLFELPPSLTRTVRVALP